MLKPPIPEPIWRRLLAFLESKRDGRIWFDVKGGHVVEAEFPERVRATDVIDSAQK